MGKYASLESDVFSVFAATEWKNEKITTFPANFNPAKNPDEFIKVDILASGRGININSVSGLMIVEIFTPANKGPKRSLEIADILDKHFAGKSFHIGSGSTQFLQSNLRTIGTETAFYHSSYSIQFNFYGSIN